MNLTKDGITFEVSHPSDIDRLKKTGFVEDRGVTAPEEIPAEKPKLTPAEKAALKAAKKAEAPSSTEQGNDEGKAVDNDGA